MKLTCLSRGSGFYFPPCHMLEICGFRVLLECPLDLSALAVFSPIAAPASGELIRAVPWYKTVTNLHLWDPSLIDLVLVSSPSGMLALPFFTRLPSFSAKIYATEVVARIGRLMVEDILSMHTEYVGFYGPDKRSGCPKWMEWEELGKLTPQLREVVLGKDGEELGSWMPLYSAADIKECMQKVLSLRYGEEACYNGTLILKAFSSGLEIGSCNWMINGPRRNITYLSSSIFESAHAMDFDYCSLQGNDLILFSDLSSMKGIIYGHNEPPGCESLDQVVVKAPHPSIVSTDRANFGNEEGIKCLFETGDISEESEKIAFICSCVLDSLKEGGSVLIPIGRIGIVLMLLEKINQSLESSNVMVPIFMISAAAEETLAFTNSVPEWLCKQRQQKLFSGDSLFGHVELIKEKKLNLFSVLHSSNLLTMWQEPCIVFCPHWSFRLGPAVHLLRRWHINPKCLLVLEEEVDAEIALLPFSALSIKVLQCSFISGIKLEKVQPLLELLQPKLVLFPDELRSQLAVSDKIPCIFYSENMTCKVPSLKEDFEASLASYLDFQLQPRMLTQENVAIARLEGKLFLSNGKYVLAPAKRNSFPNKLQLFWGSMEPSILFKALKDKGVDGIICESVTASGDSVYSIHIIAPDEAVIEMNSHQTVISAANGNLASLIYQAFCTVCNGI